MEWRGPISLEHLPFPSTASLFGARLDGDEAEGILLGGNLDLDPGLSRD